MMTSEQFKHLRLRAALLGRTIRESENPSKAMTDKHIELQAQIAHEIELRKEEA